MDNLPLIHRNFAMLKSKMGDAQNKMQDMPTLAGGKRPENTLVVIRHGSTSLNSESDERIRGWLDVPLSQDGVQEITDSLPALKKANLDGLITSDLVRCVHTAQIISKATGVPILGESPALRPWHLGVMTGRRVPIMLPVMMDYIKNKPNEVVPGGESFNQFKERFIRFIQQVQAKYPNDKIGIITHHRGERLIQGWMDAGKPDNVLKVKPEVFNNKGIPPGSFTDFEVPPPLQTK